MYVFYALYKVYPLYKLYFHDKGTKQMEIFTIVINVMFLNLSLLFVVFQKKTTALSTLKHDTRQTGTVAFFNI